jgi:hypothetical protein
MTRFRLRSVHNGVWMFSMLDECAARASISFRSGMDHDGTVVLRPDDLEDWNPGSPTIRKLQGIMLALNGVEEGEEAREHGRAQTEDPSRHNTNNLGKAGNSGDGG